MISVIVPYHRGTHFLEDCLKSLENQIFQDIEVVLVYNNTEEEEDIESIVSPYRDKLTIRELQSEKSGVGAARNKGISEAKGEYIYFLDSDDYIYPETLQKLVETADREKSDFVYGDKITTFLQRKVFFEMNDTQFMEDDDSDKLTRKQRKKTKKFVYNPKFSDKITADMLQTEQEQEEYFREKALIDLFISRKGIKDISGLGILIRKSFAEKKKLSFDEETAYYADLVFMVHLLEGEFRCSYVPDCIYIKRNHNDPEHYPSLQQQKDEEKFDQLIASYRRAKASVDADSIIGNCLQDKIANYYTYYFITRIRRSINDYWRKERFAQMEELAKDMSVAYLSKLKGYRKKAFAALLKGDLSKTRKLVNRHLAVEKLFKILKNKRVFNRYLYEKFFLKMSMKENWVLCESFFAKSYSDSPKYIYEYLQKTYPGRYRFIWVLNSRKSKPAFRATKVKRFSIPYMYYLARCKYNIFNVRQPTWFAKREGNVFLQTWHGTPLKRLVFDQEEVAGASPLYKHQFYIQSRCWDYLVSPNDFSTDTFASAFMFEKEKIVPCGYPRNDILYTHNNEEKIAEVKRKLKIPEGKTVILYAPTWRDDEFFDKGKYKFTLKLDLHMMQKQLGEDYVVVLRTHYFIANNLDVRGLEGFVYNESNYDDISELYLISDILITDYSSVFFDYANLKRPMLFYTYDLEKYRDMLRGFYLDIENDLPGPLLFTTQEVIDNIKNIDQVSAEYEDLYQEFYDRFCHLDDGKASERIAELVFNNKTI